MPTYANIVQTAMTDGVVYGTNVPLVSVEASLGDGLVTPDPIQVAEGQEISAVVKLSINGIVTAQNSYVVMQTDAGDGTWIDVAGIVWTGGQGNATFILSGGGRGQENNALQQTRQSGQFPPANFSNAFPISGRVRFVGKSSFSGGSSSISGSPTAVKATITYKLTAPR